MNAPINPKPHLLGRVEKPVMVQHDYTEQVVQAISNLHDNTYRPERKPGQTHHGFQILLMLELWFTLYEVFGELLHDLTSIILIRGEIISLLFKIRKVKKLAKGADSVTDDLDAMIDQLAFFVDIMNSILTMYFDVPEGEISGITAKGTATYIVVKKLIVLRELENLPFFGAFYKILG